MTPGARLTAEAMWGFIAMLEAYQVAYQEIASLPVGHPKRYGATQRQLTGLLKRIDALLGSCRNALRYLDEA